MKFGEGVPPLLLIGLIAFGPLLTSGCEADPIETHRKANGVDVQLLFEHDGCKVYRFEDGGWSRYFVNCGGTQSTTTIRKSGKTHHPDDIVTTHGDAGAR